LATVCHAADHGNGVVSFANSGSAAAQSDFLTGLAQLHNFQYPEAARSFRRAQSTDPGFAMAYWGEAMTYNHPVWAQQDRDAARAVLAKLGPTPEARAAKAATTREKAYLHAVEILYGDGDKFDRDRRYALAMEQLHAEYAEDIDATCFYALALLGTSHAGRDVSTYMRAAALMESAFQRYPRHPGAAHYLIHSVDDSVHAPLGLEAARAYGKIAPDSPHAMHMTSHIFLALGLWSDVVAANETAIRLANAMFQARNPGKPLPGCGHARTWLSYGYLQLGQFADARRLVEACGDEVRSHPIMASGTDLLDSDETSAAAFSVMRSRYLIDTGDWSGTVAAMQADTKGVVLAEYARDFASAYRAARDGTVDEATTAVARAQASGARVLAAAADLGIPADHPARRVPLIEQEELDGLLLIKKGDATGGVALLEKAAAGEKAIPMEFGPPSLSKPASELLGEILLALGRAQEARAAFEAAQVLAPGRGQSLIGLSNCAHALNDGELAASVDARLAKVALRQALQATREDSIAH
jgi:tetratricopeptide (TPR) repeat protein